MPSQEVTAVVKAWQKGVVSLNRKPKHEWVKSSVKWEGYS